MAPMKITSLKTHTGSYQLFTEISEETFKHTA